MVKRVWVSVIGFAIATSFFTGCAGNGISTDFAKTESSNQMTTVPVTSQTTSSLSLTEEATTEVDRGHFEFRPIVVSSIFRDIMGEDMYDAYCNYIAAVRNGEDIFQVKDEETYDWMMGQFPGLCYPVVGEYTESNYAGAYQDGKATFQYKISKEEFAKKEAEFENIVTGILNETMRDDYSDLEKVLALYTYFCGNYSYDYDTYNEMFNTYVDNLSAYRFLTTGQGICSECAPAFSYLLLEAGVDATTVGGNSRDSGEGHSWSYVTINGKNYHVDPTYGMGTDNCLSYFMMTDDRREYEGGFVKEEMTIACHYKDEENGDQYSADDDFFAPLWGGYLTSWDHDKKLIYYQDKDGLDATFDYSSFE